MKFRNVIIAGILFAVLTGYVLFIDRHQQSSEDRQAEDLSILKMQSSLVSGLKIEFSPAPPIEIAKQDGQWQVLSPEPMQADADTVESLLSELEFLKPERVIVPEANQKLDLAQYGLNPATKKIFLKTSSVEHVLLIGKKTPMGRSVYVTIQGDVKVFVAPESVERILSKRPEDFRNRVVMEFDSDAVDKMEITNAFGTKEATRVESQWRLAKPAKDKQLDQENLSSMLWELRKLKMKKYLGAQERPGTLWDKPVAKVSVWIKGEKTPLTLVIGDALPNGEFIAKMEGKPELFTLESSQVEALKKDLLKSNETTMPTQLATPVPAIPPVSPAKAP